MPELIARMEALATRTTYDGSYATSFQVMSDHEIRAVAEEIYDINLHIEGELEEMRDRSHGQ